MRPTGIFALVLLLAGGCARGEPKPADARAAADRVGQLLYTDNLVSDPEVNAKLAGYVAAIDRDGEPPDSVLNQLDGWLGQWAAQHPDRVSRARLMPRGSAPGYRP